MLRAHGVRCYNAAHPSLSPIPAVSEWRKAFDIQSKQRPGVTLSNAETGKRLVDSIFPQGGGTRGRKGKVVIEAFSGPGILTRALLQLPPSEMRKLIVLENSPKLYPHVKDLEVSDPRVKALPFNSHSWDSYDKIEEEGLLSDIDIRDWEDESELVFVATIPHSVQGEQLVAQLLRAIPERSWLFKYGRMRMNMIMPELLYERIDAPVGKSKRCKLSIIAEATSQFRRVIPSAELRPFDDHFWPPSMHSKTRVADTRRPGQPMVAATFEPRKEQIIHPGMLDKWDYCLRRLFVLKAYELQKALPSLAPGANNMTQYLQGADVAPDDRVDIRKVIKLLTLKDWESIVKAFDNWPFAPDMLYIQNSFRDERFF